MVDREAVLVGSINLGPPADIAWITEAASFDRPVLSAVEGLSTNGTPF